MKACETRELDAGDRTETGAGKERLRSPGKGTAWLTTAVSE